MEKLFVYGTLMDDTVRERVLGKYVHTSPDTLSGYIIDTHPVLTSYPVVKKSEGKWVEGVVFDVTENDLAKLDRYETIFYKKEDIVLNSGKKAQVYVENEQKIEEIPLQ